jgi:hypothetical protein
MRHTLAGESNHGDQDIISVFLYEAAQTTWKKKCFDYSSGCLDNSEKNILTTLSSTSSTPAGLNSTDFAAPSPAQTTSASTPLHPGLCQLRLATPGGSSSRTQYRSGAQHRLASVCGTSTRPPHGLYRRIHRFASLGGSPSRTRLVVDSSSRIRLARGLDIVHLPSPTLSASTSIAPTMPHLIKAKCFSIKSIFLFNFCHTRYSGAAPCKLILQVVDYTFAASTSVRRIDYMIAALTPVRRINYMIVCQLRSAASNTGSPRRLWSAASTTRLPRRLRSTASTT